MLRAAPQDWSFLYSHLCRLASSYPICLLLVRVGVLPVLMGLVAKLFIGPTVAVGTQQPQNSEPKSSEKANNQPVPEGRPVEEEKVANGKPSKHAKLPNSKELLELFTEIMIKLEAGSQVSTALPLFSLVVIHFPAIQFLVCQCGVPSRGLAAGDVAGYLLARIHNHQLLPRSVSCLRRLLKSCRLHDAGLCLGETERGRGEIM